MSTLIYSFMDKDLLKKPFKLFDLAIYSLIILLAFGLFAFSWFEKPANPSAFDVYINNNLIFTYDFLTQKFSINQDFEDFVCQLEKNKFKFQSNFGTNVIEIDQNNHSVFVVEADCGHSKECMHMSKENGIIICAPHRFVIIFSIDSEVIRIG